MAAVGQNLVPRGRPTGPSQQQANAFVGVEMASMPGVLQRTQRGGVALQQDSNNFPASQYPDSVVDDTQMSLRSTVVAGQNLTGAPVPVHYSLTDKDFEYYASKQAAEELADFERWVALQFDFKSPADVDRFAKMFPEYFERRLAVLKNVSDANLRYSQILLTGAQSSEDYVYLWLAQTGKIPLISGPLWKPEAWFGTQDAQRAKLAMFNPLKLFSTGNVGSVQTPYIPNPTTGYFNPGIPQPVGIGRQGDRVMIKGGTPAGYGLPAVTAIERGVPPAFNMGLYGFPR